MLYTLNNIFITFVNKDNSKKYSEIITIDFRLSTSTQNWKRNEHSGNYQFICKN